MVPAGRSKALASLFLLAFAQLGVVDGAWAQSQQTPPQAQPPAAPQTTLRLFIGNAQRLDVARIAVEGFLRANPGIGIEIETGGATVDQQQQVLNAALASRDASFDLFLIDVLRPRNGRPRNGPSRLIPISVPIATASWSATLRACGPRPPSMAG